MSLSRLRTLDLMLVPACIHKHQHSLPLRLLHYSGCCYDDDCSFQLPRLILVTSHCFTTVPVISMGDGTATSPNSHNHRNSLLYRPHRFSLDHVASHFNPQLRRVTRIPEIRIPESSQVQSYKHVSTNRHEHEPAPIEAAQAEPKKQKTRQEEAAKLKV